MLDNFLQNFPPDEPFTNFRTDSINRLIPLCIPSTALNHVRLFYLTILFTRLLTICLNYLKFWYQIFQSEYHISHSHLSLMASLRYCSLPPAYHTSLLLTVHCYGPTHCTREQLYIHVILLPSATAKTITAISSDQLNRPGPKKHIFHKRKCKQNAYDNESTNIICITVLYSWTSTYGRLNYHYSQTSSN